MPKPHLHQHIYPPSNDQLKTTLLAALMMQRLAPTGPIAKQQQHHHLNVSSIDAGAPPRIPSLPPFFSLDSFPCADAATDGLPPCKAPRRSQSDVPFPPYPINPSIPQTGRGVGEKRHGGEPGDDLFAAFMNFDGLGAGEDRREGLDSGANSSDYEAESSVSGTSVQLRLISGAPTEKKEGAKRSAAGDPASLSGSLRHCRSVSMDSFVGHLQFSDESPKLPPSPGMRPRQHSRSNSMAGAADVFSLEFRNGEFTAAELKKIMANDKLQDIARTDPKRVKRILANRQSAARSKERKMRYISELEHKVQKLQSEATTLSAQLTSLQRDSAGLTSQNHELKFRLQAMGQQAQLRDALNEALSAEVQRLKLITAELGDQASLSKNLNQKVQINSRSFQSQQQQSTKMTLSTATTAAE